MTDIEELIGRCVSLGLDGVELLSEIDRETIKREYNGIGPEFFPVGLRDKVTEWLALFEPAALIHDLRNYRSDGMRHAFNYANMEFLANCRKCVNDKYGWWNWKRYRALLIAEGLYDFVSGSPGWKAWIDCYEKNKETEKDKQ